MGSNLGTCATPFLITDDRIATMAPSYDPAPMTLHEKFGLVACACHLALAILAVTRRGRSPLALPLALLCIDLFVWNAADLAGELSGDRAWEKLDAALSWLAPPLALQIIAGFVGRARSLRPLLAVAYVFFAQLPFWAERRSWEVGFGAGIVVSLAVAVALLVMHLVRTTERSEKVRTRSMLCAITVAILLGSSDLWRDYVGLSLSLSNIGMFAGTLVTAVVVLQLEPVGREIPSRF